MILNPTLRRALVRAIAAEYWPVADRRAMVREVRALPDGTDLATLPGAFEEDSPALLVEHFGVEHLAGRT